MGRPIQPSGTVRGQYRIVRDTGSRVDRRVIYIVECRYCGARHRRSSQVLRAAERANRTSCPTCQVRPRRGARV